MAKSKAFDIALLIIVLALLGTGIYAFRTLIFIKYWGKKVTAILQRFQPVATSTTISLCKSPIQFMK